MPGSPDLTSRRMFAERMDQPELDDGEHRRALRALARVNVVSGVVASFWKAIRPLAHNRPEFDHNFETSSGTQGIS